ncbi:MAG: RHS repeat-associated core domain-containing protein, partial [Pseudomonadota bacterium]
YEPGVGRYFRVDPIGLQSGMNIYGYAGANPMIFIDPLGLYFFGKCKAKEYLEAANGDAESAWMSSRQDRDLQAGDDKFPGTPQEALRNAEHYLYAYMQVQANSYDSGTMYVLTVGYHVLKFWANVADFHGVYDSRWKNSWPTIEELNSGFEGVNDALFSDDISCSCQ